MKNILLIGLGRFGRHIAMKLNELNHQVLAVDEDEDRVNAVNSITRSWRWTRMRTESTPSFPM